MPLIGRGRGRQNYKSTIRPVELANRIRTELDEVRQGRIKTLCKPPSNDQMNSQTSKPADRSKRL